MSANTRLATLALVANLLPGCHGLRPMAQGMEPGNGGFAWPQLNQAFAPAAPVSVVNLGEASVGEDCSHGRGTEIRGKIDRSSIDEVRSAVKKQWPQLALWRIAAAGDFVQADLTSSCLVNEARSRVAVLFAHAEASSGDERWEIRELWSSQD